MKFSVKITEKSKREFDNLTHPERGELIKATDGAMSDLADYVYDRALVNVPSGKTHMLRTMSFVKTDDFLYKEVEFSMPYAVFVEYGTGIYSEHEEASKQPIIIKPKHKKALKFEIRGETIFAKQVISLGMHPQPYLRPAVEEGKAEWPRILKNRLRKLGR